MRRTEPKVEGCGRVCTEPVSFPDFCDAAKPMIKVSESLESVCSAAAYKVSAARRGTEDPRKELTDDGGESAPLLP